MRQSGSDNNRIAYAEDPRISRFRIGAVLRTPDRTLRRRGEQVDRSNDFAQRRKRSESTTAFLPDQLQALMRWSRSKTNATWPMLGSCDQTTTRMAREGNPVAARMASE
jgi:hypothetical protein